jgi:hypothetical protein
MLWKELHAATAGGTTLNASFKRAGVASECYLSVSQASPNTNAFNPGILHMTAVLLSVQFGVVFHQPLNHFLH